MMAPSPQKTKKQMTEKKSRSTPRKKTLNSCSYGVEFVGGRQGRGGGGGGGGGLQQRVGKESSGACLTKAVKINLLQSLKMIGTLI